MARNPTGATGTPFKEATDRPPSYRETIERERSQRDVKNAKLKALRLAKEAVEYDEAIASAAREPVTAKAKARTKKASAKET